MLSTALFLAAALVQAPTPSSPLAATVQRWPRLEKRGDVALWRQLNAPAVFAQKRTLWLRSDDPEVRAVLRRLGLTPKQGWQLVHLDGAALTTLTAVWGELELRSALAHRPLLDLSIPDVRADRVQTGVGVELSRRGAGVLVGLIDTGLDLGHPAFRNSRGESRVVASWDQDRAGTAPEGFDYGDACDAASLREDRCALTDELGHGTHVAGIVAGSGALPGLAPDADLAVVRSQAFTRLADAVEFLLRVAEERDQPLVINASVGAQYGAHDGRTPLEHYLDDALGPGRLLVAAAGNDGEGSAHAGCELTDRPRRIGLDGLPMGRPTEVIVELWSDASAEVNVAFELWRDGERLIEIPLQADASEVVLPAVRSQTGPVVELAYGVDVPNEHGLARRTVVLDGSEGELPSGAAMVLRLSGRGRFDAWLSQSDYRYGVTRFSRELAVDGFLPGDGARTITVPASGRNVVAVGAYTVRNSWRGDDAKDYQLGEHIGARSPFSSLGPTLAPSFTGIKPDILAPGSVILSARAFGIAPGAHTQGQDRLLLQGTSMAAPMVAGALALALEADPELGPQKARRMLAETARLDGASGLLPNDAWGHGKLDVQNLVRTAELQATGCAAGPAPMWAAVASLLLVSRRRRGR